MTIELVAQGSGGTLVPADFGGVQLGAQLARATAAAMAADVGDAIGDHAGAIFLGNYSPVAVGDFLAGPSHTLPTGGSGKSFPGITADMFQKRTSIVRLSNEACAKSEPIVRVFSEIEGLDAHGASVSVRGQ